MAAMRGGGGERPSQHAHVDFLPTQPDKRVQLVIVEIKNAFSERSIWVASDPMGFSLICVCVSGGGGGS